MEGSQLLGENVIHATGLAHFRESRDSGSEVEKAGIIGNLDKVGVVISDILKSGGVALNSLVKGTKFRPSLGLSGTDEVISRVESVELSGTSARLSYREWSGEYRLRCVAQLGKGKAPPAQSGDRTSVSLTSSGAEKIAESCEFMSKGGRGYSTFITLTLDEDARRRLTSRVAVPGEEVMDWCQYKRTASPVWRCEMDREREEGAQFKILHDAEGDYCHVHYSPQYVGGVLPDGPYSRVEFPWASSISREVSRFVSACKKMHARGWSPHLERMSTVKVGDVDSYCPIKWSSQSDRIGGFDPKTMPLAFIWVAEAPVADDGVINPHVHMLLNWAVSWRLFPAWKTRLEALWGLGFAHIERLRSTAAAGGYIAKAAGYLTKGEGSGDQGLIRGNRYGMSRSARAPGWVQVFVSTWGVLGNLIGIARDAWIDNVGKMRERRDDLNDILRFGPLGSLLEAAKFKKELDGIKRDLAGLPIVIGRYQVIFRGDASVVSFMSWLRSAGWKIVSRPVGPWLEESLKRIREYQARRSGASRKLTCPEEWQSIMVAAEFDQAVEMCDEFGLVRGV